MRKHQQTLDHVGNATPAEGHAIPLSGLAVGDNAFITDHDAVESGRDEDCQGTSHRYTPFTVYIFYSHSTLLTHLFVIVWLLPYFK